MENGNIKVLYVINQLITKNIRQLKTLLDFIEKKVAPLYIIGMQNVHSGLIV